MVKNPIFSDYSQRKEVANSLRKVLYVANSFYGNREEITLIDKKIDSNIYSSLVSTMQEKDQENKNRIGEAINIILYGRELQEFNKFDLDMRKKILETYNPKKNLGILGISKREQFFKKLEKKGIDREKSRDRISKLEDKINKFNIYKKVIDETKINQNGFGYLNSFVDSYRIIKSKNGIEDFEIPNMIYSIKLLSLLKNKSEATAIEAKEVLFNLYDQKFKGIKKKDFFDKVRESYFKKISGRAIKFKINESIDYSEDYKSEFKNTQAGKLKKLVEKEGTKIDLKDDFELKFATRKVSELEKLYDETEKKFEARSKTKKVINQANNLERLVQREEKEEI